MGDMASSSLAYARTLYPVIRIPISSLQKITNHRETTIQEMKPKKKLKKKPKKQPKKKPKHFYKVGGTD